jgi:putative nucleotidyltransferase with HDIG domain
MKPYQEIEKILSGRCPDWWERIINLIPELGDLEQVPQPPQYHAEGDVAEHTRLAVEACSPADDPDLVWAALLHDVGKAFVTKLDGNRITAHGHDVVGAEMALSILDRLQMPAQRRDKIVWAVRHHTFHLSWNLNAPGQASKRQKRFVAGERFPYLLELLRVDSEASLGNPRGLEAYELYRCLRESIEAERKR